LLILKTLLNIFRPDQELNNTRDKNNFKYKFENPVVNLLLIIFTHLLIFK